MLAFERYMTFRKSGGNHCQLNVLPLPQSAAASARNAYEQAAARHGFALQPLEGPSKVPADDFWNEMPWVLEQKRSMHGTEHGCRCPV